MSQDNRNENEEDEFYSVKAIYAELQSGHKNTLVDIERIAKTLDLKLKDAIQIVGEHYYFVYFDEFSYELTNLEGFERLRKYSIELKKAMEVVKSRFVLDSSETKETKTGMTPDEINAELALRL
ncbi:MAG: hypothetical protein IJ730_04790 [Alphaproteobacteria bacterium]|nr:hypothetical protein [Alphaproteobacteria bacterium]MBR2137541.1 hypothetical protein [Alphaproteobacteria bacterium]